MLYTYSTPKGNLHIQHSGMKFSFQIYRQIFQVCLFQPKVHFLLTCESGKFVQNEQTGDGRAPLILVLSFQVQLEIEEMYLESDPKTNQVIDGSLLKDCKTRTLH